MLNIENNIPVQCVRCAFLIQAPGHIILSTSVILHCILWFIVSHGMIEKTPYVFHDKHNKYHLMNNG